MDPTSTNQNLYRNRICIRIIFLVFSNVNLYITRNNVNLCNISHYINLYCYAVIYKFTLLKTGQFHRIRSVQVHSRKANNLRVKEKSTFI